MNMKKVTYFFSLAIILIAFSGYSASAQGRGHHYGREKDKRDQRDNDNRDRNRNDNRNDDKDWNKGNDKKWSYGDNDRHDRHHDHGRNHHNWERRNVRHYYHTHDRYCNHQPVVVHHYVKPRYIYYRDYDVYYDCHKSVYISYSGGSWSVSGAIPLFMRSVDMRRASRWEVDYWDDNLPGYLQRRRPACDREYFGG
jgi:hypothetical protein